MKQYLDKALLQNPVFADDTVIRGCWKVKTRTQKADREKLLLATIAGGFKYTLSKFQNNIEYARWRTRECEQHRVEREWKAKSTRLHWLTTMFGLEIAVAPVWQEAELEAAGLKMLRFSPGLGRIEGISAERISKGGGGDERVWTWAEAG